MRIILQNLSLSLACEILDQLIGLHSFESKTMLISCFYLLIAFPYLHTLECYSPGLLHFPRSNFHWTHFSSLINHRILSNVSSCHLRITVDYQERRNRYVTLQFSPDQHHRDTHMEFGSMIEFHSHGLQTLVSYFDYRCSAGNLCDQDFLQIWPKIFLQNRNTSLHQHLLSAWKYPHQCEEKFRTNYCESYLCFHLYNELKNLTYTSDQCEHLHHTHPVHIHIQTKSGKIYQEYQCRKNHCTGEIFYPSLMSNTSMEYRRMIEDEYPWKFFMSHRGWIIIVSLILIGLIAYLIQCRKYRQGYRLTRQIV